MQTPTPEQYLAMVVANNPRSVAASVAAEGGVLTTNLAQTLNQFREKGVPVANALIGSEIDPNGPYATELTAIRDAVGNAGVLQILEFNTPKILPQTDTKDDDNDNESRYWWGFAAGAAAALIAVALIRFLK